MPLKMDFLESDCADVLQHPVNYHFW